MTPDTPIDIVMPYGAIPSDDLEAQLIEAGLRLIAQKCGNPDNWPEKYGADYRNDVFTMHPFCWCDEDACPYCAESEPNFTHYNSGLKVWWYKYIGRGMEIRGPREPGRLLEIIRECMDSIVTQEVG